MKQYLLCTDLDRTLIPNGKQPQSELAPALFKRIVSRDDVTLAYVTGRHRALIEQAIADFDLPQPDYVIADVGTTIYEINPLGWHQWTDWDEHIAPEMRALTHQELCRLLSVFPVLRMQEKEKQNRHKLSFYVPLETESHNLLAEINTRLSTVGIKANLIWSIDEVAGTGLLDVIPASANKLLAILFLMQIKGFRREHALFAGDSGNDLDVLMSDIPAVLVANADDKIKSLASKTNNRSLYIAKGGYLGMSGNYSAGILEGAAHYWPEVDTWLRE